MLRDLPSTVQDAITRTIWDHAIGILVGFNKALARRLVEDSTRPLSARLEDALNAIGRRRKWWELALLEAMQRAAKKYHDLCQWEQDSLEEYGEEFAKKGLRIPSQGVFDDDESMRLSLALLEIPFTIIPSGSGAYDRGVNRAALVQEYTRLRQALARKPVRSQRDLDAILALLPDCWRVPLSYKDDDELRPELRKGPGTAAVYILHKVTKYSVNYLWNLPRRERREQRSRKLKDTQRMKAMFGLGNSPPLVRAKKRPRPRLLSAR